MLFDESVKEKLEDFFNRDEEIDLLRNAIITGRKLILVLGIRRIGKSSLIRVVLNSMKIPYLYFDIRAVYHKYHSITNYSLYQLIETNINNIIKSNLWSRIGDYLKRIKEISIAGVRVRFNKKINQYFPLFYRIFNAIDEWCTGEGKKAVIVFDEAQYLRFSRFNFRGLFAYI